MTSVKQTLSNVTDWLRTFTEFGLALVIAFVVIDVLFPNTTGVVSNIGAIVGQFSKEGIAGLIALLLFLLLFRSKE